MSTVQVARDKLEAGSNNASYLIQVEPEVNVIRESAADRDRYRTGLDEIQVIQSQISLSKTTGTADLSEADFAARTTATSSPDVDVSPEIEAFFNAGLSKTPTLPARELAHKIEMIFYKGREEFFEDGMESDFSASLVTFIESYGNAAVHAIGELMLQETVDAEVASEALRWLGHVEHPRTYHNRLRVLESSLSSPSARIRDGAILGLASLDDPHAIPYLRDAIKKEPFPELGKDMQQVLDQLENSISAVRPETDPQSKVV